MPLRVSEGLNRKYLSHRAQCRSTGGQSANDSSLSSDFFL